jgi:signal transduction histidine kinase/CheY-like chemotaxis protein
MSNPDENTSSSQALSFELEETFREIQSNTINLAILGVALASLTLFGSIPFLDNFVWAFATGAGLLLLGLGLVLLSEKSFITKAWFLIVGSLSAVLSIVIWGRVTPAVCLLIFPVGLANLTLGTPVGVLLAAISSIFLLFVPDSIARIDIATRNVALSAIWGTVGLIWLTLRPLLTAIEGSWTGYEQSRHLLNQARDYQMKLQQSLEDLTFASTQLTRLNQLANSLRKIAEDERRAKEQFVANVSHELRTPLNMIIGFCEMILKSPRTYGRSVPANLLADLEVVLRNSQHLASLIDDVLDLSQIDAGQIALVKEPSQIDEIIQAAAIAVRPLYESKGLYLKTEFQDALPEISCDRTRIREVVLNLLSNAGRFTEKGGVTVQVWQEGNFIIVSVADTGKGISEKDKSRLFRPFEQLDGTIRRRYGGTGLGLSISKSFVELHDGKMWVESQEAVGTTFFFRLPIEPPEPLHRGYLSMIDIYQTRPERVRRPQIPPLQVRPRLVVVEKGNVLHRVLSRYMQDMEIEYVPDLEKAIAEVGRVPARALVVNGFRVDEVLKQLNETTPLPYNTPAIICSIPGLSQQVNLMGISDYLVKPISRDRLLSALEALQKPIRTLLIVDDEPDALQLFRRMLTSAKHGYRVLRANNGLEALDILRQQKVDVILLDLIMPEMDGFQFLAEKEKSPEWQDIPVILISARDPQGQPIVSNTLTVTRNGGLSVNQLLACVGALSEILSPVGQPAGLTQRGISPG